MDERGKIEEGMMGGMNYCQKQVQWQRQQAADFALIADAPLLDLSRESAETVEMLRRNVGSTDACALADFAREWWGDYEQAGLPYGGNLRGLLRWFDEDAARLEQQG